MEFHLSNHNGATEVNMNTLYTLKLGRVYHYMGRYTNCPPRYRTKLRKDTQNATEALHVIIKCDLSVGTPKWKKKRNFFHMRTWWLDFLTWKFLREHVKLLRAHVKSNTWEVSFFFSPCPFRGSVKVECSECDCLLKYWRCFLRTLFHTEKHWVKTEINLWCLFALHGLLLPTTTVYLQSSLRVGACALTCCDPATGDNR